MKRFIVRLVDWNEEQEKLSAIRHEVFVIEQKVPVELEVDGLDGECVQVLAEDVHGNAIGTARLMPGLPSAICALDPLKLMIALLPWRSGRIHAGSHRAVCRL